MSRLLPLANVRWVQVGLVLALFGLFVLAFHGLESNYSSLVLMFSFIGILVVTWLILEDIDKPEDKRSITVDSKGRYRP